MVFVADSATSVQGVGASGEAVISNVYMGGDKIFNLYRGLPIMAMTCGMASIGGRTISSLSKELRSRFNSNDRQWRVDPTNYTIREVAEKACRFFWEERKHYYPAHLNNREIDHVGAAYHPAADSVRRVPDTESTAVRLSRARERYPVCRPKRSGKPG